MQRVLIALLFGVLGARAQCATASVTVWPATSGGCSSGGSKLAVANDASCINFNTDTVAVKVSHCDASTVTINVWEGTIGVVNTCSGSPSAQFACGDGCSEDRISEFFVRLYCKRLGGPPAVTPAPPAVTPAPQATTPAPPGQTPAPTVGGGTTAETLTSPRPPTGGLKCCTGGVGNGAISSCGSGQACWTWTADNAKQCCSVSECGATGRPGTSCSTDYCNAGTEAACKAPAGSTSSTSASSSSSATSVCAGLIAFVHLLFQ